LPDGRAAGGRPIEMLTLIDEFAKQALAIHPARRACGARLAAAA
jgi:hypothetical protein